MKLDKLPKFKLADFPTPVTYLENLTRKYSGPSIYMKRDDLTSLGMGGNKTSDRQSNWALTPLLQQAESSPTIAG